MSRVRQAASPVEFIGLDATSGKFKISDKALSILNKITGPIAVVALCGRARQGKSYLLNQIVRKLRSTQNDTLGGFAVSASIRPCTKGLWLWSEPIALPGVGPDGRKCHVVLMDCEGIDAFDQTHKYSTQIFSLAVLLSSLFVFNQIGGIDETALERLSLVSELSRVIYSKANSEGGANNAQDFSPAFLWLLRDFSLKMPKDGSGKRFTPNDYLEEALQLLPGNHPDCESRNQVRESIRSLFPDRQCCALVRPHIDEDVLENMDNLPITALREEFRKGLDSLVDGIIVRAQPKRCFGVVANGPALAGLADAFVTAINEGALPQIDCAWQYVMRSECARAVGLAKEYYCTHFNANLPADEGAFTTEHMRVLKEATDLFHKEAAMAVPQEQEPFLQQLHTVAQEHMEMKKRECFLQATVTVNNLLSAAAAQFTTLMHNTDPMQPSQLAALEAQVKEFVAHYQAKASGPTMYPRLLDFLQTDILPGLRGFTTNLASKANEMAQEVKAKSEAVKKLEQKAQQLDVDLKLSSQKHELSERELTNLRQEQSRLHSELGQLRQERLQTQSQLAKATADANAFMQQVHASKAACEELTKQVSRMQQELMTAQVNLSRVTAERDNLANLHSKASADVQARASDVSKKEAELLAARAEQQQLQAKLSRQEKAAEEAAAALKSMKQELDEMRAQYQQAASSASKTHGDLTSLQQQLAAMSQKEREARLQAENMKQQYEAVAEKEREARQLAISLQGQVREVEERKREELQAAQARVARVMEEKTAQAGEHDRVCADLHRQLEAGAQTLREALKAQEQAQNNLAAQQQQLAATQATLEQALMEKSSLLDDASAQHHKLQEATRELATQKVAAQQAATQLEAANQELATQRELSASVMAELEKATQERDAEKTAAEHAVAQLEKATRDLEVQKGLAEQVASELASAKSEVALSRAELGPQLAHANASVTSLQQQLEEAEARLRTLQAEKSRLQSLIDQDADLRTKVITLEESLLKVTSERDEARSARDEAVGRQRELRGQLAMHKHVGRISSTNSPLAPGPASAAFAASGRLSTDASGTADPAAAPASGMAAKTTADPLPPAPAFTIGVTPRPAANTTQRTAPARRAAPAARNNGYSSPVINMFANFERASGHTFTGDAAIGNNAGGGFEFKAGATPADRTTTSIKEEDGANTTPVPIPNMSPVDQVPDGTPVTEEMPPAKKASVGAAAMQGVGEEDDSPSAPPVPEPAESLSLGVRGGREKRKREEDASHLSPDVQRQAKRAGAGRQTPPVMAGHEGTPTSALSKEPTSPYGTPITNPEGMTITEIKEWLSLNGHADAAWQMGSRKPKKADWVRLIREKAGLV